MFFRKMTEEEQKNTGKAAEIGFVFYAIVLLVNSIYSYFVNSSFDFSFMVLIAGLIVFYVSSFIFNQLNKRKV